MINFNKPPMIGNEGFYIQKVINNMKISGDGEYTHLCNKWLEENMKSKKVLLTTSCTHALEMAAILANIEKGDEIIMPSYTFVSTANAFVLRGALIKFIDIDKKTLNMDANLIGKAITNRTKAIVPVHYGGVSCDMDEIIDIAKKNNLIVIEDAAQGVMSKYKGKNLGTIADIGCYSFHETKNYSMGEGGAILLNNDSYIERAEVIREKGTNRKKFLMGEVDKYSWIDIGSSYLPSELNAAYLYPQLLGADTINNRRLEIWNLYYATLIELQDKGFIELPYIPEYAEHNAHMFYVKLVNLEERINFINFMSNKGIMTIFHYVPLHSSLYGRKVGEFVGNDVNTTKESERLVRLPLYFGLLDEEVYYICESIKEFFKGV